MATMKIPTFHPHDLVLSSTHRHSELCSTFFSFRQLVCIYHWCLNVFDRRFWFLRGWLFIRLSHAKSFMSSFQRVRVNTDFEWLLLSTLGAILMCLRRSTKSRTSNGFLLFISERYAKSFRSCLYLICIRRRGGLLNQTIKCHRCEFRISHDGSCSL